MDGACQPGDRVTVEIESMAYGPHAIARSGGLVLFVRGAVPGERVEVVIRERRRSHAFADVANVELVSPQRARPACPIVDRCGGCPWQHLDYGAQLEAKRRIVGDQLARIGGVDAPVPPVLPSPRVYGYRRRIKLRVEEGRVGFYAGGTHDLVSVAHCALAESEIDTALASARRLAAGLTSNLRRLEVVAHHRPGGGLVMAGEVEGVWRGSDTEVCRRWLDATPACSGLTLRGKGWKHVWGDMGIVVRPDDALDLVTDGAGFSQVNPTANEILVGVVMRMVGDVSGKSVLDAYAGAGNFSAPLASRGALVLAVEQSRDSCRSAERNAADFADRWRVRCGRVEKVIQELSRHGETFDVVVLDPPRSGARDSIDGILGLRPPVVVYVSCDPATLARDLGRLGAAYRVDAIQPIDMFPHTYHVENVVRCVVR